jgi:L-Ala-D/L-Glu epimerase
MTSSTTIRSVDLYKLFLPLKEPFVISLGPITEVQNVIVVVHTHGGLSGWGECSPYMTINGESVDTCFIVGQYFGKVLNGKEATDITGCVAAMDKTIYANSSIKSAFDIALHDIAAQAAGQPLYQYLGGNKMKELHTDMTVSIGEPEKMKNDAVRFQQEGFQTIKVKLGETLEKDLARIKAIREGIGMEHKLCIDANQGWETPEQAIAVLKALAPFRIEHCEEPISRHRFMELSKVSAASPIPIMADESCGDEWDAERLIALKACHQFNIKLGKSSGLYKGLKIARLGEAAGMKLQVGGFMESRLGMTAAAHLALANDAIHYCDFDTPLMYTEDPVEGGLIYERNGRMTLPQVPGLGASIARDYLEQAEQVTI